MKKALFLFDSEIEEEYIERIEKGIKEKVAEKFPFSLELIFKKALPIQNRVILKSIMLKN